MTLSLEGDIGARQAGSSGEANPILGPPPPGSSCPTIVTMTCGPHQFDQSNRLLPWPTLSCAMAGAPSTPKGRPCGSARLSRRMWPSTAQLRPALSVTIGAITTVEFSPCATSRIRSSGGSQCADAEADVVVDVEMVLWLDVGLDIAEFTCDVHDEVRLPKASNVAAIANGLMLIGSEWTDLLSSKTATPSVGTHVGAPRRPRRQVP